MIKSKSPTRSGAGKSQNAGNSKFEYRNKSETEETRNPKSEIRNKSEIRKTENQEMGGENQDTEKEKFAIRDSFPFFFIFPSFEFVSDFDIRISDFLSAAAVSVFLISRIFPLIRICFGFRYSNFEFRYAWRGGAIKSTIKKSDRLHRAPLPQTARPRLKCSLEL